MNNEIVNAMEELENWLSIQLLLRMRMGSNV